ncbi:Hypothetical_protein [Hexamita inflata]|uniref:Hypothetical_protein n=1 Tax=Hexamita inflata TaxID=28002 RepID=A0AA86RZ12_9EUKA|nr:Hypothetical protein HINF_LOCUS62755 [Hexamita inflata]
MSPIFKRELLFPPTQKLLAHTLNCYNKEKTLKRYVFATKLLDMLEWLHHVVIAGHKRKQLFLDSAKYVEQEQSFNQISVFVIIIWDLLEITILVQIAGIINKLFKLISAKIAESGPNMIIINISVFVMSQLGSLVLIPLHVFLAGKIIKQQYKGSALHAQQILYFMLINVFAIKQMDLQEIILIHAQIAGEILQQQINSSISVHLAQKWIYFLFLISKIIVSVCSNTF